MKNPYPGDGRFYILNPNEKQFDLPEINLERLSNHKRSLVKSNFKKEPSRVALFPQHKKPDSSSYLTQDYDAAKERRAAPTNVRLGAIDFAKRPAKQFHA